MSGPLLEVRDLAAGYGRGLVLHGVDLMVQPGEIVGIAGPNGSGKSTLLRAVFGLIDRAGGSVLVDGQRIARGTSCATHAGMFLIPQRDRVFPKMSVQDNLSIALDRLPRELRASRLEPAFEAFPFLRAALRRRAGELSGGEQQMVALARLIIIKPRVWLLDEPSSGLTEQLVERLFFQVGELVRTYRPAVLVAEHRIPQLLSLCDRLVGLRQGRIVLATSSESVRLDPNALTSALFTAHGLREA